MVLLGLDKEFYLFLIRMVFLWKRIVERLLSEKFLWECVRCDASNRLLRNSSHDYPMWVMRSFVHLGDVHELSSLTRIHVVSTGSHPKIPPKKRSQIYTIRGNSYVNTKAILCRFVSASSGVFCGGIRYSLPPPTPQKFPFFSHFFLNFWGFLGFPLLNQRIIGDLGGVPGGGIFSLIFPWI